MQHWHALYIHVSDEIVVYKTWIFSTHPLPWFHGLWGMYSKFRLEDEFMNKLKSKHITQYSFRNNRCSVVDIPKLLISISSTFWSRLVYCLPDSWFIYDCLARCIMYMYANILYTLAVLFQIAKSIKFGIIVWNW